MFGHKKCNSHTYQIRAMENQWIFAFECVCVGAEHLVNTTFRFTHTQHKHYRSSFELLTITNQRNDERDRVSEREKANENRDEM